MIRVVITGMGAITPLGNSVKEFWNNIVSGKSAAAPITKFDASNCTEMRDVESLSSGKDLLLVKISSPCCTPPTLSRVENVFGTAARRLSVLSSEMIGLGSALREL